MQTQAQNKKDDHVRHALNFHKDKKPSHYDLIQFVHQVFSSTNVSDINISTYFGGHHFEAPFYINGMTGGTSLTKEYNEKLAILARETKLFIASGSVAVGVLEEASLDSFRILRKMNPNGIIYANIGADKSLEQAKKAIEIVGADGLQIHVNLAQELVMPEGERVFNNWLDNIDAMVEAIDLPITVKEVGFGMSKKALEALTSIGVKTIDVAGKGGTDFARIENARRPKWDKYNFIENFGNSTSTSMLEAQEYIHSHEILASGGIRNSLDIVKMLALGARSVGMAGRMLNLVDNYSLEKAIDQVENWKKQIRSIMALLDAKNLAELQQTDLILQGEVREWCELRGIDYKQFATRNERQ